MNLQPNSDEVQIIDAVASFMAEQLPVSRYRDLTEGAAQLTPEEWQKVVDLGWIGLGLEEQHGGLGCSVVEEILMFREVGRQVGPLALLGSVIGARVAALAGQSELRDSILSGKERVAIAIPAEVSMSAASRLDGAIQLFGTDSACYAVLVDQNGAVLFETDSLLLSKVPCLERHLSLATATLKQHTAIAYVEGALDPVAVRLTILASAMQVGGAEATRDMSVAYAKERQQFGQLIGSFQAIKHICADMAVRCEEACTQLFYSSLCLRDRGIVEARREIAATAFLAARAGIENAAANIQVHGGIGMTAELAAHWYLKRAHVLDQVIGNSRRQLDLLVI
ncbi:Putative Acyl-CoA dehydrogenase [Georgfuchsia toluolica]|uniref:Acyl-CoA dehydrogenase n=1 Tax=Georgfuchsia toluolica TaxID=424218 RepID=A0A916N9X1_9PROT|nr:acyl-CoA dehydrogenase family protein [Georgfuchsia toluolica]CAG4885179.1 Putative Acyl-CoA dehydrogenase [Georgfuchsia toluolica]